MTVPSWRRGAVYHRPLTDGEGMVTGREVTIYPMLFSGARLCEGKLAASEYDHEYTYDTIEEAVSAAERWSGHHSPPGKWTNYRSQANGDIIDSPELVDAIKSQVKTATESMQAMNESLRKSGISVRKLTETVERKRPSNPNYDPLG